MMAIATPEAFARRFAVSRETMDRLRRYEALLEKWNRTINLVAAASLADLWSRHFADSAQLLTLAPPTARSWIDLGSGAGFPGLVVAIVGAEKRPSLDVSLVEADARKAAFLATVSREAGVPVRIRAVRAESLSPAPHDVVSARALAPLTRLLALALPLLGPGGLAILPKGATWESELTAARRDWHMEARDIGSLTDPAARILCIGEIARAARVL